MWRFVNHNLMRGWQIALMNGTRITSRGAVERRGTNRQGKLLSTVRADQMQQVVTYRSAERDAGLRLDVFLAARLPHLSRMGIARLLAEGACTSNGAAGVAGQLVQSGQLFELVLTDTAPNAMTPEPLPLAIVYEDGELLVVDKPAGLLVHPTRGVKSGTLVNALAYHLNKFRIVECGLRNENETTPSLNPTNPQSAILIPQSFVRPGLVHRLDRATSGLMVIAKTQRALGILARHFHQRLVAKSYLALVRGCVAAHLCMIDAPIGRAAEQRPHWRVSPIGKPAQTRLRIVERDTSATLVELEPVTGRTNQLRIHCAHVGHAIVGDEWYDELSMAEGAPGRLCLHAARLAFNHPTGGRWLEFTSPLPQEIACVRATLAQA